MSNKTVEQYKLPIAVAAAAVGGFTLFKLLTRGKGQGSAAGGSASASPSRSSRGPSHSAVASMSARDVRVLTPEDLLDVLRALHVSDEGVAAFREGGVDGAILLQIREHHMNEMGLRKVGDRIRVADFIKRFADDNSSAGEDGEGSEAAGDDSDDEVVLTRRAPVPVPAAAAPAAAAGGRPRTAPTNAATNAGAAGNEAQQAEVIKVLIDKLRALYELFGSEEFLRAPHAKQLQVVRLAEQDLRQIDAVVATLPPAVRGQMDPLVGNLREVIGKVGAALSQLPAEQLGDSGDDAAGAAATETSATGADGLPTASQLAQMLKHFHALIESDDMANAPAAERNAALESIVGQLSQISRLSATVPEEQRRPLQALCQSLIAMADHMRGATSQPPSRAASQQHQEQAARSRESSPQAVQHASLDFITKRFRALFDALKQPAVLHAAPAARQRLIRGFRKELESLKRECAHLPAEQAEITSSIAVHVEQVVAQLEKITAAQLDEEGGDDNDDSGGHVPEEIDEGPAAARATPAAPAAAAAPEDALRAVTQSLTAIVQAIKSPAFSNATAAERGPMVQMLGQRLNETVKAISALPNAEREAVSPMASQVVSLIQTLVAQSQQATALELQLHEQRERHQRQQQQGGSPAKKAPLVSPAATPAAASTAAPAARASAPGAPPAGSAGFQQIVADLRGMFERVKAPAFKAATPTDRVEAAIEMMTALQHMLPVIQGLRSEAEQAASAKLASSLMDLLKNIAQSAQAQMEQETLALEQRNVERKAQLEEQRNSVAARIAAGEEAEEADEGDEAGEEEEGDDATAQNADAMGVVGKLTELFNLIQSPTFTQAQPRRQVALARAVLEELAALRTETEGFDAGARGTIMPLIDRLQDAVGGYATALTEMADAAAARGAGASAGISSSQTQESGASDEAGEDTNDTANDDNAGSDDEARAAVFDRAVRITRLLTSGALRRVDQLRDAIELMDEIDALGIRSQEEIEVRQAFHRALMATMQQIEAGANAETAANNAEAAAGNAAADEDEDGTDITNETGSAVVITPPMRSFIQKFQVVSRELNAARFTSREEMLPFLQIVDELLSAADDAGLQWKACGAAVNIVGDVLTRLQNAQDRLRADGNDGGEDDDEDNENGADGEEGDEEDSSRRPNSIAGVLRAATKQMRDAAITEPEQLMPFIALLERAAAMEDSLTVADLRALQHLQEEVIRIGNSLSSRLSERQQEQEQQHQEQQQATPKEASPKGSPKGKGATPAAATPGSAAQRSNATPLSPQSAAALRVPPNTPILSAADSPSAATGTTASGSSSASKSPAAAAAAAAGGSQRPLLDELEAADDGAAAPNAADDETVLQMLAQLAARVETLRFQTAAQLEPFELILDRVRQGSYSPAVTAALRRCDEVVAKRKATLASPIAAKRAMMEKIVTILNHERFVRLPQANKLQAIAEAKRCIHSLTDDEARELNDVVSELLDALKKVDDRAAAAAESGTLDGEEVPGSFMSDLSLVPRIVERVREADFCENTTLFEMRCIDKILNRLTEDPNARNEPDLLALVREGRNAFTTRLTENTGPMKDPTMVACPLVLTGQTTEDDCGNKVIRSLMFSQEEEEEFTINEQHLKMFDQKPMPVADPSSEMLTKWSENSVAILVTIPRYDETEDAAVNETILSEANIMHDIIESQYGFAANSFTGTITATAFRGVLQQIAERKPARLLFYFQTPQPAHINAQHAVLFSDGLVMTYAQILEAVGLRNFGHALVIHDSVRTFELLAAHDGKISPLLGVSLSEGAFTVSNCSRCWLFDGLFTPIVAEYLMRTADTETTALCAEDLVNNCITVLSARILEPGSYVQDNALAAPFLLPIESDADDDDDDEEGEEAAEEDTQNQE